MAHPLPARRRTRRNITSASSIAALAREANVEPAFVERLLAAGVLPADVPEYGSRELRRVRLLHAWEDAGLTAETVMALVDSGALSLGFLDTPLLTATDLLDRTYREVCIEQEIPLRFVQQLHEAIGFVPPNAEDRARSDDATLIGLAKLFLSLGASEAGVLRLFRVYADSLRRIGQAEAELFEAEIEGRLRTAGLSERQLLDFGSDVGTRINALLEGTVASIYKRHREHIWIAHSTNHAEVALDQAGLHPRAPRLDTICFVDLAGYTRLTEERGDVLAARFAAELAALVETISSRRGGRPIRWLGDGGMFHFREARAAVLAALDMVDGAPAAGLPPTHIGIHTGPVIFQDGDVYGRTVNLASRIASQATAGEVLATRDTVEAVGAAEVAFQEARTVELKGIAEPVVLYRAERAGAA
jgi:adenylate cyclase